MQCMFVIMFVCYVLISHSSNYMLCILITYVDLDIDVKLRMLLAKLKTSSCLVAEKKKR